MSGVVQRHPPSTSCPSTLPASNVEPDRRHRSDLEFAPQLELRHPVFVAAESNPLSPLPEPSRLPHLVWLLLLLLAAYVLSPGPVMKLMGPNPPIPIEVVYAPLAYAYDHIPAVQSFYDWYFKLWGIK